MIPIPRVTFGMIVLNGEPFVRYNLRALYPFAHQIIVVEGAAPAAANIVAADGHSRDGTLDTLRNFKTNEDPENKLSIITAEDEGYPNGFWPGEKDEQSQAYARRATGDYLWQVDVDEFYKAEDMQAILKMLGDQPEITAVSFKTITFWGGFDYLVDGWYLRQGAAFYHRLFKWGPGYHYITHRPPTVLDNQKRNLRQLRWITGQELAKQGIILYHYSLLLPKQVIEKCDYYSHVNWTERRKASQWAQETFLQLRKPYRVHNVYDYPSWLEPYNGEHPTQVQALRADLEQRRLDVELRPTADVKWLLQSPVYCLGRAGLKFIEPIGVHWWIPWRHRLIRFWNDPVQSWHILRNRISRWITHQRHTRLPH